MYLYANLITYRHIYLHLLTQTEFLFIYLWLSLLITRNQTIYFFVIWRDPISVLGSSHGNHRCYTTAPTLRISFLPTCQGTHVNPGELPVRHTDTFTPNGDSGSCRIYNNVFVYITFFRGTSKWTLFTVWPTFLFIQRINPLSVNTSRLPTFVWGISSIFW